MFGRGSSKTDAADKSAAKPAAAAPASAAASKARNTNAQSSGGAVMEVELNVVSTPEPHLVFTNFVYVSVDTLASLSRGEDDVYVLLKDAMVFIAKAHKALENDCVALSAPQRENIKVSVSTPVKVARFVPPTAASFNLVNAKLDIALISKRKVTVKEAELTAAIRNQFKRHVISRGQSFVMDFEGSTIKATVRVLEAAMDEGAESKDGSITQFVRMGTLLTTTHIVMEAEETKMFKLEKDTSKAQSRLFSPNFQFADMGIGGLDREFNSIFRRAFASRLFPAEVIEQMGIKHVRGMLLYGPPGTGTLLLLRFLRGCGGYAQRKCGRRSASVCAHSLVV
jgi:vesicle-fusing ATPase